MNKNKKQNKTKIIIIIALMAAIAEVLTFFEFNIPIFPSFLKFDFALLPAVITSFLLGPIAGVIVSLVTNLLHLLKTTTGGVGELANFLVCCGMLVPAGMLYMRNKTKGTAIVGLGYGIIGMVLIGAFANYFILLPFYEKFMPLTAIINMIPGAKNKLEVILLAFIPFNAIKGTAISLLTLVVYKKLSSLFRAC